MNESNEDASVSLSIGYPMFTWTDPSVWSRGTLSLFRYSIKCFRYESRWRFEEIHNATRTKTNLHCSTMLIFSALWVLVNLKPTIMWRKDDGALRKWIEQFRLYDSFSSNTREKESHRLISLKCEDGHFRRNESKQNILVPDWSRLEDRITSLFPLLFYPHGECSSLSFGLLLLWEWAFLDSCVHSNLLEIAEKWSLVKSDSIKMNDFLFFVFSSYVDRMASKGGEFNERNSLLTIEKNISPMEKDGRTNEWMRTCHLWSVDTDTLF